VAGGTLTVVMFIVSSTDPRERTGLIDIQKTRSPTPPGSAILSQHPPTTNPSFLRDQECFRVAGVNLFTPGWSRV